MEESHRKIRSRSEKVLLVISHGVLALLSLCSLVPFILLVISSLTPEQELISSGYTFWPKAFSLEAYEYLVQSNGANILRSYGITIAMTIIGTIFSLLITPMLAYVLSRKDYCRRGVLTFLVFFTMLFNGGLVPTYMVYTRVLMIKNTWFAYLIPGLLLNAFNVLLMKSYFAMNIHPAMVEAAKIDGAGEGKIYYKIILPLSLPIMATIGLMVGINYWNDWMNPLYYVTKQEMWSLQSLLNRILNSIQVLSQMAGRADSSIDMPGTAARMAIAVIGVIPIMVLYPFFQKYFVKGISLGGVKE